MPYPGAWQSERRGRADYCGVRRDIPGFCGYSCGIDPDSRALPALWGVPVFRAALVGFSVTTSSPDMGNPMPPRPHRAPLASGLGGRPVTKTYLRPLTGFRLVETA